MLATQVMLPFQARPVLIYHRTGTGCSSTARVDCCVHQVSAPSHVSSRTDLPCIQTINLEASDDFQGCSTICTVDGCVRLSFI